jgi:small conductance mechanosensitive channel
MLTAAGTSLRGRHPSQLIGAMLDTIPADTQIATAIVLGKLAAGALAIVVGARLLRRALAEVERAVNERDGTAANDRGLARLFGGLLRALVLTAWMLLAIWAGVSLRVPPVVTGVLLIAVRLYVVVAIGLLIIRSADVAVATVDSIGDRAAQRRGWGETYGHLRPLLPTLRTCLEYALWIAVATLVLQQLGWWPGLVAWGPRLVQAVAIFFAGRVAMELGLLEISRRMLPPEGLSEADRRRRTTIVPLVRTAFVYVAYFSTAVLMLSALGFNPMPFLAGAGILGLVIGFGAQSLINDVVSGFFILLENMYLVGDTIEVASASGVVEGIEFRTTKIRDADGRLHIIRNGAMTPVVNYSKDYTMAVVPVEVTYDADLRAVFGTLRRAGERLREEHPDVLADMEIAGITTFGTSAMTVRTSTRVKPGRHDAVAAALRLLIKELFDRQAAAGPRKTLVPPLTGGRASWPAAGQSG